MKKIPNSHGCLLPRLLLPVILTLCVVLPATAQAQSEAKPTAPAAVISSIEKLSRKLETIKSDSSISKEEKTTLEGLYQKAISNLESTLNYEEAAQAFLTSEKEALKQADSLRKEIQQSKKVPGLALEELRRKELDALEAQLLKEEADLSAVVAQFTKARERVKYHTDRPQIIRNRLIEANRDADGIASELQKPDPDPKRLRGFERALRMFEENRKLGLDDKTILIEVEP
jgi:chromosome segregation ATPase